MSEAPRFLDRHPGNFFLFGPRGTGKSTWLRHAYPSAASIDLLDPPTTRTYLAHPEYLNDFIKANTDKNIFIIDEIQRVPQMLSVVHQLIERNKSLQFILTGSSARKLKQAGVDLLAGRAISRSMHPFMAAELGDRFDLDTTLRLGLVPLVCFSETPEKTLRGYIDLYLEQEIKAEGMVRRLDDFSRFLEIITFSQGQVLNLASIARECKISRNTVESYVSILEDLLLAVRIAVFSKRAQRALITHEKFYLFDCGVFGSLRPKGPLDIQEETTGPALEGLVLQHLRAWIDYKGVDLHIHFWHTLAGNEVDFVLYGNDGFHAIEVKNSQSVRLQDLRGLKSFRQDYPQARCLLLYRGTDKIERDGIRCMPIEQFVRQCHPAQDLPY